ncbi:MAG: alpha/beta fold hydrolase [Firmicutes bacterium]|nr:alpha/beta fold hydrolase [Bacillota bacterium]
MEKLFIPGRNGYDVPVLLHEEPEAGIAVVVTHGFGSDKYSATARRMQAALAEKGAASVALDLPAHGESPVDGHFLTVENAINDIAAAEELLRSRLPRARIAFFGSSFGAYLTALYLAKRPLQLTPPRAVLRCAALTMPRLLQDELTPAQKEQLRAGQDLLLPGYEPPLLLTQAFLDSLNAHDPFAECRSRMADVLLIHGTADEVAPIGQARRFSRQFGYTLLEIEGADHRFQGEGQMDRLVEAAVEHICS